MGLVEDYMEMKKIVRDQSKNYFHLTPKIDSLWGGVGLWQCMSSCFLKLCFTKKETKDSSMMFWCHMNKSICSYAGPTVHCIVAPTFQTILIKLAVIIHALFAKILNVYYLLSFQYQYVKLCKTMLMLSFKL